MQIDLGFWIFFAIGIGCLGFLCLSLLFGGDHDHDHDLGHDVGHDHDHADGAGTGEPTVSIFSTKVLLTFGMGFGCVGSIAKFLDASTLAASLYGIGSGVLLGLVMLAALKLIYKQQASSNLNYATIVGQTAKVTVSIDEDSAGEIGTTIQGEYTHLVAHAVGGKKFARGINVKIIKVNGSEVVVDSL